MLRSSQPLSGPNNRRCREDETLLMGFLDDDQRGYIIDTRTSAQAKLATAKGSAWDVAQEGDMMWLSPEVGTGWSRVSC